MGDGTDVVPGGWMANVSPFHEFPAYAFANHDNEARHDHAPTVAGWTLNVTVIECGPVWSCGSRPLKPLTLRFPVAGSIANDASVSPVSSIAVAIGSGLVTIVAFDGRTMMIELIAELPVGLTFVIVALTVPSAATDDMARAKIFCGCAGMPGTAYVTSIIIAMK